MKCITFLCSSACIVGFGLAPLASQGAVAYDYTPGGSSLPGNQVGEWALANTFTVNQAIQVTGLRVFDAGGDGIGGTGVEVSLHRFNTFEGGMFGFPVVGGSFTFTGTAQSYDAATGTRFVSITPVSLIPGATYMIVANHMGVGANASEQNYNVATAGGSPTIPTDDGGGLISFTPSYFRAEPTWSQPFNWTEFPTTSWNQAGGFTPAYAAGNFDFTPVPEAQHFAFAGAALMGLVYAGRSVISRRKAKA